MYQTDFTSAPQRPPLPHQAANARSIVVTSVKRRTAKRYIYKVSRCNGTICITVIIFAAGSPRTTVKRAWHASPYLQYIRVDNVQNLLSVICICCREPPDSLRVPIKLQQCQVRLLNGDNQKVNDSGADDGFTPYITCWSYTHMWHVLRVAISSWADAYSVLQKSLCDIGTGIPMVWLTLFLNSFQHVFTPNFDLPASATVQNWPLYSYMSITVRAMTR